MQLSLAPVLRTISAAFATCILLAGTAHGAQIPDSDGLFATFSVSQGGSALGSFTVQLDYERAPLAVANFIGLAEGTQTWIDPVTYAARDEPFYDGIIFHRVIANFMIQGGSPQGNGMDGPGYTFPDEFDPALRHDAAGVLSMANSGPHSNGSQFFITLRARTHLDDVHTVFGTVIEGIDVVQAIGAVAVDGSDKPLVDVEIGSVIITRNGSAAQSFDPSAQPLPRVEPTDIALQPNGNSFVASYTEKADRQYFSATSTDLLTWTPLEVSPILRAAEVSGGASLSLAGIFDPGVDPQGFLRQAAVRYPDVIFSPPDAVGKALVMTIAGSGQSLVYNINTPPGTGAGNYGTASLDGSAPQNLIFYSWGQGAYRVRFVTVPETINRIIYNLVFESATEGIFTATVISSPENFQISGTFIFSDVP